PHRRHCPTRHSSDLAVNLPATEERERLDGAEGLRAITGNEFHARRRIGLARRGSPRFQLQRDRLANESLPGLRIKRSVQEHRIEDRKSTRLNSSHVK